MRQCHERLGISHSGPANKLFLIPHVTYAGRSLCLYQERRKEGVYHLHRVHAVVFLLSIERSLFRKGVSMRSVITRYVPLTWVLFAEAVLLLQIAIFDQIYNDTQSYK